MNRKRHSHSIYLSARQIFMGTGLLFAGLIAHPVCAQVPAATPSQTPAAPAKPATPSAPAHFQINHLPRRAEAMYTGVWGVDSLTVKTAEAGELVRFSYRVIDPEKAKVLNDKKYQPALNCPEQSISLVIPSLEKVGQLRQSSTPEAGKSYWMAFSNPGRRVKRGDRVDVVIGQFKAEGLIVE